MWRVIVRGLVVPQFRRVGNTLRAEYVLAESVEELYEVCFLLCRLRTIRFLFRLRGRD